MKRGKLERCLFVHESNETRVVSHVDDPLICAKPATLEKFWTTDNDVGRDQERRSSIATYSCNLPGHECRSAHDGDRTEFMVKPTAKYVDECWNIVQLQRCEGSDDAFDGTEELESTR